MVTFKKIMLVVLICVAALAILGTSIFFLSFKTDYLNDVKAYAKQYNVDAALVLAVIKAESKFNANAKSSADAIGLMQVRLETANYMLLKLGQPQITQAELFNPQTNIKLGTKYLQYLFNRFNNVEVSICAYNAGETIVAGWLKDKNYSDNQKTLKNIPFAETQNYLKKVMFNYSVYKNTFKIV